MFQKFRYLNNRTGAPSEILIFHEVPFYISQCGFFRSAETE